MAIEDTISDGNCYKCSFYNREEDSCRRGEKAFGSMISPICLQKLTIILLRDLNNLVAEYLFEDEE